MATRTELLALRAQIERAEEGRSLLSDKRAELMAAFRDVADAALAEGDAFAESTSRARRALAMADAVLGPESVGSAALTARGEVALAARARHVMGVSFAEIERAAVGRRRTARGYSMSGTSASIDEVAESFEGHLDLLVRMAAVELRLRRLADELRKVSRRVNALEHVVIPRLVEDRLRTRAALDEREREDRFRLQRFKRRRTSGRPA